MSCKLGKRSLGGYEPSELRVPSFLDCIISFRFRDPTNNWFSAFLASITNSLSIYYVALEFSRYIVMPEIPVKQLYLFVYNKFVYYTILGKLEKKRRCTNGFNTIRKNN